MQYIGSPWEEKKRYRMGAISAVAAFLNNQYELSNWVRWLLTLPILAVPSRCCLLCKLGRGTEVPLEC